jgi:Ca2+-binding RTX toxin-like protein
MENAPVRVASEYLEAAVRVAPDAWARRVIVITANDATAIANPQIVTRAVVVGEGDGYVDLVVGLSVPRTTPLTIGYATVANTAFGLGSTPDYFDISSTLTFTPGQTSKTLRLHIINDATAEVQESLFLRNTSGNILAAQPAITIVDNDSGRRVLSLGASDDIYSVTATSDIVVENPAGGTDRGQSPVTYTLPTNVENLTLTGAGAINGTGNTAANQLVGNTGANTLNGLAGNDVLTGGAGSDTILSGTGADTIVVSSTTGSDTVTDFSTVDDTFGSAWQASRSATATPS